MKESIVKDLSQRTLHEGIDEFFPVQVIRFEHINIGQTKPIDPLHREYFGRCEFTVDLWHKNVGDARVELIEALRVGRLSDIINLSVNEFSEIIDNRTEVYISVEK